MTRPVALVTMVCLSPCGDPVQCGAGRGMMGRRGARVEGVGQGGV